MNKKILYSIILILFFTLLLAVVVFFIGRPENSKENRTNINSANQEESILDSYTYLYMDTNYVAERPTSTVYLVQGGVPKKIYSTPENRYVFSHKISAQRDYLALITQGIDTDDMAEVGILNISTGIYKSVFLSEKDSLRNPIWNDAKRLYFTKYGKDNYPMFSYVDFNEPDPNAVTEVVFNKLPPGDLSMLGAYKDVMIIAGYKNFEGEMLSRIYSVESGRTIEGKYQVELNLDRIASPSGLTYYGYTSFQGENLLWLEPNKLYIRNLITREEKDYSIMPYIQSYFSAVSPDGQYVVFETGNDDGSALQLSLYNLAKKVEITADPDSQITDGTWTPDTRFFLFSTNQGEFTLDVASGKMNSFSDKVVGQKIDISNIIGFIK